MKLSGPIRVDFFRQKKKFLFLVDCHTIGNGCSNTPELVEEIYNLTIKSSDRILLLVEAATDVLSEHIHFDLVQFAHGVNERIFPANVTVRFTDCRRAGPKDEFWLYDFLQTEKTLSSLMLDLESVDLPQAKTLKKYLALLPEQIKLLTEAKLKQGSIIARAAWLMDCYTYSLIKQRNDETIVYYAGQLHIDNLLYLFGLENLEDYQSFDSSFTEFCTRHNCQEFKNIQQSSNLPEARCIDVPLEKLLLEK